MQKTAILGAAGIGKTHILMEKVSRLLEEPAEDGILILVSSAGAANDIRARLESDSKRNHPDQRPVTIHTIVSLCEAALNESEPETQILSDFRAWFILRECIRSGAIPIQSSYDRVKDKHSFTSEVLELIEMASVNSISIDELPDADQEGGKLADIKNIHKYYRDFCHQNNLIPAFDVIPRASGLLRKYCQRFSHVFVDQYEDLCPGETRAVSSLAGNNANITIFMDSVRRDSIGGIDVEKLDGIYGRLSAGMSGHMNRLLGKNVYSDDGQDDHQSLTVAIEETAVDEAEYIARTIKREKERAGRKYSHFAILCRDVENLAGTMRDALKKYSIPCSGGVDISHDPLVRFILLSLQVADRPDEDDVVLKWLSSPVAGLDRADVYRAYAIARRKKQVFYRLIEETLPEGSSFHNSSDRLGEILPILDFVKDGLQNGSNVWELVSPILALAGALPEGEVPRSVIVFMDMIRDIEMTYEGSRKLTDILNDARLGLTHISDPDMLIYESDDVVRIMSIRESRGLEFPFVFVPGMVSDFFPARHPARQLLYGEDMEPVRAVLRDIDLPGTVEPARWHEQERHLLYIAMTRAKESLYLTFARQYPDRENCEPSSFLVDLLEGKEVSADNCGHYGIIYQDSAVSSTPDGLPSLDNVTSRSDLEIACCHYVRELKNLDGQKAAEALEFLSSSGAMGELFPPPAEEIAIPQPSSASFSNTAIRNFLSCPRRYFLSYLLKVDSEDQASAHFGRLVHDVLSKFHKQYPELQKHELEELWESMSQILSDERNDRMESGFAGNRLQALSYLRLANEVLRAYLQGEHSRWDENRSCILTEKNFRFSPFGKYQLIGRMDRIDACAPGGNEIMDFKTSAFDTQAEGALKSKFLNMDDDPDYRPEDFQLPIYYLAGLSEKNLNPQKLVIYQLRNFSKSSGTPFRRELEIYPDEDTRSGKKDKFLTKADMESVKGEILWTLERMVSGSYPPEPRDDNVCERECDFSFLCEREGSDNQ